MESLDEWLAWLDERPHLLLAAESGGGKSVLAGAVVARRVAARGDHVAILDPHWSPSVRVDEGQLVPKWEGAGGHGKDGEGMRAITLTQPWATLVAIGAKRIETRSWQTSYCGPLAIHAGASLKPVGGLQGLAEIVCSSPFWEVLTGAGYCGPHPRQPELGAIVAVATLAGCVPIGAPPTAYALHDGLTVKSWPFTEQEREFGDYTPGRWAWLLADVRRLPEPVPCKGALGLWTVPADVLERIGV